MASYEFQSYVTLLGGDWETSTLADLFSVPAHDMEQTLGLVSTESGHLLSPMAKGRLIRSVRRLADAFGVAQPSFGVAAFALPSPPAAAAPPATSAAPGPPGTSAPVEPGPRKLKFSQVLCPGDDREFVILSTKRLKELARAYKGVHGTTSREYETSTEEQLSALAARAAADELVYADLAIFGPYGKRLLKAAATRAQIFVRGELITKSYSGPQSYAAWRLCWRVYRDALIRLKISRGGPLDEYEEGIRILAESYPHHWIQIAIIEDMGRFERWPVLRMRHEEDVQEGRIPTGWSKDKPWESVLLAAAYGSGTERDWWFARVDKPCLQDPDGTNIRKHLAVLENTAAASSFTTPLPAFAASPAPPPAPPSAAYWDAPPPTLPRGEKRGREQPKAKSAYLDAKRRPDGRFSTAPGGAELCYRWNRAHDGCSEPCSSAPQRRHLCEWCLGPHRAVDPQCTVRPNGWKPDSGKGKRKGSGKW